ncbi:hypothetical protein VTN00DRAFT_9232 [Thermoascus crustaceus]|uniref:uncharacterized protein n=1 Tax=Thermoascus crustaceus TaxID=5088 RepID=UPI003743E31F
MDVGILFSAIPTEFSYRIRRAPEEPESYINVLETTDKLITRVRQSLQEVAAALSTKEKQRIERQIGWAQSALTEAKQITITPKERGSIRHGLKNLWWVIENKEVAKNHMDAIARCYTSLARIYLQLAMARGLSATHGNSSETESESPSSPRMRRTSSSVSLYEVKDDLFYADNSPIDSTPSERYGSSESLYPTQEYNFPSKSSMESKRSMESYGSSIYSWLSENAKGRWH